MTTIADKLSVIKKLVEKIAPESVSNLNEPTPADELERLRAAAPHSPEELFELLRVHNGEEMIAWTSLFPDGMQLMDVQHILESAAYRDKRPGKLYDDLEELVARGVMDRPQGPVRPIFSHRERIAFAHVNAELLWYLDMDPAEGGDVGQLVYEDAEDMTLKVVARSLEDLLDNYIRDLRAGKFLADEDGQIKSESVGWYMGSEV